VSTKAVSLLQDITLTRLLARVLQAMTFSAEMPYVMTVTFFLSDE
jgi:hypothetical protein